MRCLLLLASSVFALAQGTLTLVNPASGNFTPGTTVALNVVKAGNPTAVGAQFTIGVPANLGSISVALGPDVPALMNLVCNYQLPAQCLISGELSVTTLPDGVIAVVNVSMYNYNSLPATITLGSPSEVDSMGNQLTVSILNATANLTPIVIPPTQLAPVVLTPTTSQVVVQPPSTYFAPNRMNVNGVAILPHGMNKPTTACGQGSIFIQLSPKAIWICDQTGTWQ